MVSGAASSSVAQYKLTILGHPQLHPFYHPCLRRTPAQHGILSILLHVRDIQCGNSPAVQRPRHGLNLVEYLLLPNCNAAEGVDKRCGRG
jgi:hypothetical protein